MKCPNYRYRNKVTEVANTNNYNRSLMSEKNCQDGTLDFSAYTKVENKAKENRKHEEFQLQVIPWNPYWRETLVQLISFY